MTVDEVRAIVEKHLRWFKWALGLQSWTVYVQYCALDRGLVGACYADTRYETATIQLDNDQIDSDDEVLETLRHELLHILHSEFDAVFDSVVGTLDSKAAQELLRSMHKLAQEKTVKKLEYALDAGLGVTAVRLMDVAALQARRGEIDDFEEPILPQDISTAPEVAS